MQRQLNHQVTASGQISPSDFAKIKEAGYVAVVDSRPDGEVSEGLHSSVMKEAAEAAGLSFTHIPVTPGSVPSVEDARRFSAVKAEGPVFAYCGGGPRAIVLASLAAALDGAEPDAILTEAAEAGMDLSPLRPILEQYRAQS